MARRPVLTKSTDGTPEEVRADMFGLFIRCERLLRDHADELNGDDAMTLLQRAAFAFYLDSRAPVVTVPLADCLPGVGGAVRAMIIPLRDGMKQTPLRRSAFVRKPKGKNRGVGYFVVAAIWERDGGCSYGFDGDCSHHRCVDHVVPRSKFAKNRHANARLVEKLGYGCDDPRNLVAACGKHNEGKGSRLLIPESHRGRLGEYNDLGIGTFRVWDGSIEALRTVVR